MSKLVFTDYLNEYLSAYWLRPVTAVVRALEAEILGFERYRNQSSLELACGDGINSFIATGGKVPTDFDVFQSMPVPSAERFFGGQLDVYDSFEEKLQRFENHTPFFSKGVDHKQNLVDKARLTGAYEVLECRDLNQGLEEPGDQYDLIFSNSIYWVKEIDNLLRDMLRCLKPGGTVKLSIIKKSFLDQMAWTKLKNHGFRTYIDMGRHTHYQQLSPESDWEKRFERVGFQIEEKTPTFNSQLAHMIEFHDYREISPITNLMAKKLSPADHREVKAHWISYANFVFSKMHEDGFFRATPENSNYNIYTLTK